MTPYAYPSSRKPFRAETNSTVPNPLLRTSSATPWAQKTASRYIVTGKTKNLLLPCGNITGNGLAAKRDFRLTYPLGRKIPTNPVSYQMTFVSTRTANQKTSPLQPPQVFFNIGQIIQPHQHIHHNPGTVSQLSAVANKKNWTNPSFNLRLRRTTNNEL